jgi:hypothetical protein
MKAKPRKRLMKKGNLVLAKEIVTPSLVDEDEDDYKEDFERNSKKWKEGKSSGKEKRHKEMLGIKLSKFKRVFFW